MEVSIPKVPIEHSETLKQAALPLIKYLAENWHPHAIAIVTNQSVEVLSGELNAVGITEFLKD